MAHGSLCPIGRLNPPTHPAPSHLAHLARWHVRRLRVLCLRERHGVFDATASLALDVTLPELSPGFHPAALGGWEPNERGKAGPRIADLAPAMDPRQLAEAAVQLNLRLMRWRAAPALDVGAIGGEDLLRCLLLPVACLWKPCNSNWYVCCGPCSPQHAWRPQECSRQATRRQNTSWDAAPLPGPAAARCLLLGAGTLGCSVARALLGWGVKHITLVDNSRVAYSNPASKGGWGAWSGHCRAGVLPTPRDIAGRAVRAVRQSGCDVAGWKGSLRGSWHTRAIAFLPAFCHLPPPHPPPHLHPPLLPGCGSPLQVRQSLFTFEDCLAGGRPKAAAAAEALARIFPGACARGVRLSVPMPGHPLAEAEVPQVGRPVSGAALGVRRHWACPG